MKVKQTLNRRKTMATENLSKKIGAWDALNNNVRERFQEMPPLLAPALSGLDEVIAEARELQGVQDVHRRQLRETTQRSQDLDRRGRKFRNQLIAGLQGIFGVESMVLIEFGIEPRLPQKRSRRTPEERAADLAAKLEAVRAEIAKKG
jgi:DNA repair ATPase RecN